MSQLALPLQLADHAVFASFLNDGNEILVATLSSLAAGQEGHGCWIWGSAATGKTHLLQAVCEAAGDRAVYIPLSSLTDAGPDILEGLASRELICIDDVDLIVGQAQWEAAFFDLCNQIFDAGGQLLMTANTAPRECVVELADLRSRFLKLPVFQIQALDENARVSALQLRSRHRGLELPDDTARYLLKRSRRDMASLYEILDRLDKEALRAKRRLTIPFVRDVLTAILD
ncbi:MAG: DnaA regulatory inactivator Hda [Gammaproteobacteria bacterium]|jgi:DnaA-homolog protein|nr:DnaA regulatory inactivator Hda [Gammaproteobacteria bacterium]